MLILKYVFFVKKFIFGVISVKKIWENKINYYIIIKVYFIVKKNIY